MPRAIAWGGGEACWLGQFSRLIGRSALVVVLLVRTGANARRLICGDCWLDCQVEPGLRGCCVGGCVGHVLHGGCDGGLGRWEIVGRMSSWKGVEDSSS